jgi:hypothetical protein
MSYRMRIVGLADGRPTEDAGRYLVLCDVDARDGRGEVTTTPNRADARLFATIAQLLAYWRRQSTVQPRRDDGEPNRPLTAYTIETEPAG